MLSRQEEGGGERQGQLGPFPAMNSQKAIKMLICSPNGYSSKRELKGVVSPELPARALQGQFP